MLLSAQHQPKDDAIVGDLLSIFARSVPAIVKTAALMNNNNSDPVEYVRLYQTKECMVNQLCLARTGSLWGGSTVL